MSSLLDWQDVLSRGSDSAAYLVMALIGTLFFLLRLLLALFGGDADVDGDMDVDAGAASDASFSLFSLLSVLAFFMGAGWMGLSARLYWGLGGGLSALLALGFGVGMMLLASGLTYGMRRLNSEATYEVATAVGRVGRVYLTVPEKGQGRGQVEVAVSGRRKVLEAVSTGPSITAFAEVDVVAIEDGEVLIVAPRE